MISKLRTANPITWIGLAVVAIALTVVIGWHPIVVPVLPAIAGWL